MRFVRNRNSIYTSSPRGVNTATSVQVVQRLLRVCEAIGELFGRFVVCGVNVFLIGRGIVLGFLLSVSSSGCIIVLCMRLKNRFILI